MSRIVAKLYQSVAKTINDFLIAPLKDQKPSLFSERDSPERLRDPGRCHPVGRRCFVAEEVDRKIAV